MWRDLGALSMICVLGGVTLVLGACSSNKPEQPQQDLSGVAEAPLEQAPAAATKPSVASFSVQEWGLFTYSAQGAMLRGGPTRKDSAPHIKPVIKREEHKHTHKPDPEIIRRPMKKPVIYLKPGAIWDAQTPISVEFRFAGTGRFREVWPTPKRGPQPPSSESFKWENIKITAQPCAAGWAPASDSQACKSLIDGDECEGSQLETWVPQTPRCLDVDGIPAGALVYNGSPQDLSAPLAQVSAGVWKNTSEHALGGLLIRHKGALYAVSGLARDAQWSAAEQTQAAEVADAKAWALEQLKAQGLGAQEADDFMRAWSPTLDDKAAWAVFGFFESAAIEGLVTLHVQPKPTAVTRVLALTIEPPL